MSIWKVFNSCSLLQQHKNLFIVATRFRYPLYSCWTFQQTTITFSHSWLGNCCHTLAGYYFWYFIVLPKIPLFFTSNLNINILNISAPPSEKPSIIHLLDSINSLLYRTLETTSIFVTFTDECIFIAQSLSVTGVDKEALALARLREADRSKKNEKFYYQLIQSLTSLLNSGTLHWRLYNLGVSMLSLQVIVS